MKQPLSSYITFIRPVHGDWNWLLILLATITLILAPAVANGYQTVWFFSNDFELIATASFAGAVIGTVYVFLIWSVFAPGHWGRHLFRVVILFLTTITISLCTFASQPKVEYWEDQYWSSFRFFAYPILTLSILGWFLSIWRAISRHQWILPDKTEDEAPDLRHAGIPALATFTIIAFVAFVLTSVLSADELPIDTPKKLIGETLLPVGFIGVGILPLFIKLIFPRANLIVRMAPALAAGFILLAANMILSEKGVFHLFYGHENGTFSAEVLPFLIMPAAILSAAFGISMIERQGYQFQKIKLLPPQSHHAPAMAILLPTPRPIFSGLGSLVFIAALVWICFAVVKYDTYALLISPKQYAFQQGEAYRSFNRLPEDFEPGDVRNELFIAPDGSLTSLTLSQLETIDIDHAATVLGKLPDLKSISIQSSQFNDKHLELLASLPGLESISIEYAELSPQAKLPPLSTSSLHELDLWFNMDFDITEALKKPSLTNVSLAGPRSLSSVFETIDQRKLPLDLHLNDCELTTDDYRRLSQCRGLSQLTVEDFTTNDANLQLLLDEPHFTRLFLEGASITDDSIELLLNYKKIVELSGYNYISERGNLKLWINGFERQSSVFDNDKFFSAFKQFNGDIPKLIAELGIPHDLNEEGKLVSLDLSHEQLTPFQLELITEACPPEELRIPLIHGYLLGIDQATELQTLTLVGGSLNKLTFYEGQHESLTSISFVGTTGKAPLLAAHSTFSDPEQVEAALKREIGLTHLKNLESVSFDVTELRSSVIDELQENTKLRHIELRNESANPDILARVEQLKHLDRVVLSGSLITSSALQQFAATSTAKEIDLRECQLPVENFLILESWKKFETLGVPVQLATPEGLRRLASLKQLSTIRIPSLPRALSAEQVEALKQHPTLKELDLTATQEISSQAFEAMHDWSQLKKLTVSLASNSEDDITTEAIANLKKARPDLTVVFNSP